MSVTTKKLRRGLGVLLLALGSLSAVSCDDEGSDGSGDGGMSGGFFDNIAKQCGLACPSKGVVEGNASITGYGPTDSFFQSVVNFNTVAAGASADIDAELGNIRTIFGIDASISDTDAKFVAAVKAQLATRFNAAIQVRATPAKCSVDAKLAAQATVDCQARANCNATPPKAEFQCMGTCTVDADVSGSCSANAKLVCEISGPDLPSCDVGCDGTCRLNLTAAAACSGTCNGSCSGTCEGNTNTGGGCTGKCNGMCMGTCDVNLGIDAACSGTCTGTCRRGKPPTAKCEAEAKATCDIDARVMAQCSGSCRGDFEPPMVTCDAAASCEASAKAEAKFNVTCTPPSIDVRLIALGGGELSADARFAIGQLQASLPRLQAAVDRAGIVDEAGNELTVDGKVAANASFSAIGNGNVDQVTKFRILTCGTQQLNVTGNAIATASGTLRGKIATANAVKAAFGMVN